MKSPLHYMAVTQKFSLTHKGVDLGWKNTHNVPVYSVASGICVYNRKQDKGGYVIGIYHPQYNMTSEYGHLKKDSQLVHEGDKVKEYQQIATMGNSGKKANGSKLPFHLHFGLQKGKGLKYGVLAKWIDPLKYLNIYDDQITNEKTSKLIKHTKIVIAKDGLNVRNKPSTKGEIIYTAKYNSEVENHGLKKGWNIVDNINNYYCANNYLK